ncbi:aminotransferase class I/II-fold pyridoxal phosphate-dependent enzyme [Nitratifractor salsuginis]|uniref:8-amino-7-oxononanoate synthase n=1 Tax=Nitratifractor salsuginis (strain DSM 16511 / JCM 12458 / E9I37-1) TaxID=749222 RepID=E6X0H0_NITSE|nr:aminotransferase class I/II-fold pyridoxal phosphate-dependent enzyme [Nitratifractor salsuginis]ADV46820.1 8-amino-7-oxononanoate synthase [Nitratifractor salsuginis DSM 16511]
MPYSRELEALRRAGRFRERRLYDPSLIDFASNDYLGLAEKRKQLHRALHRLEDFPAHAPKASMLVNGYHPVHQLFEDRIAELNGFEGGIIVGSGYLANLGLIEALVRKKDRLFIDEEYHASGMMATGLLGDRVSLFRHNDPEELRRMLRQSKAKRKIVAVEGVYSMSGDLAAREIFEICEEEGALLIVDEAHSSGVLGRHLLGIFEHYGIAPCPGHIKMGTLGKAYGSYGAYILAEASILSYLENRAKPIIYSTAPSVIDTALALENLEYIRRHAPKLRRRIGKRRQIVQRILGRRMESLILPIPVASNTRALELQRELTERGWLVGAIRQPTVPRPILRIIPRLGAPKKELKKMLSYLKERL